MSDLIELSDECGKIDALSIDTQGETLIFTDEKGNPVLWKLRKLTTRELENIRAKTLRINAKKRDVQFDNYAFNNAVMAESVVFPNLKDAKLADALLGNIPLDQRTPGNVLYAILTDDAEYQAIVAYTDHLNERK